MINLFQLCMLSLFFVRQLVIQQNLVFLGIAMKYNIFVKDAQVCKESLHFISDVNLEDSFTIIFLFNIFPHLSLMAGCSLRNEYAIFIIRKNA